MSDTGFIKAIIFDQASEGRQFVDFVHVNGVGRGTLIKTAAERDYSPEVMHHVRNLKPKPGKTYPLISALGDGAVWGPNSNADYFAEEELVPKDGSRAYGYKSFEAYAKPYKHHINKPDSPAYGEVLHSVYNPRMHRVELLVCLDNASAPDIAERMDAGEDVPVSMGCKVPYDVCSICGNKAKNTDAYCDDMKYRPGQVMSDGRRVFVFNIQPRFFDISFVFVGADKTARVMAKVASQFAIKYPAGLWAHKLGYHFKDADITKSVPGHAENALQLKAEKLDSGVKSLAATEAPIPKDVLGKIAAACGDNYNGGLATLTQAGVVLSPREFQDFIGETMLRMDKTAQAVCRGPTFNEFVVDQDLYKQAYSRFDFSVDSTLPEVAEAVAPIIEKRSAYQPFLGGRVEQAVENVPGSVELAARSASSDTSIVPLLGSLAALYAAYRDKIPATQLGVLDKLVAKNPALLVLLTGLTAGGVLGINHMLAGGGEKLSSAKHATTGSTLSLGKVLGIPALAYMYSGHQQRRKWRGEELGPMDSFVAEYPWAASLMGIYGASRLNEALAGPKLASALANYSQDALRSCGDTDLMDYKATLGLLELAERRAHGVPAKL